MPVFFFIDPDFLEDPQMSGIETVTLSYTFFSKFTPTYINGLKWGADLHKQRLSMTITEYYDQLLDSCIYICFFSVFVAWRLVEIDCAVAFGFLIGV